MERARVVTDQWKDRARVDAAVHHLTARPRDPDAVAAFVEAMKPLLVARMTQLLRGTDAAPEDAAHDIIVSFLGYLARPDTVIAQPEHFLNRVATNHARDLMRAWVRRGRRLVYPPRSEEEGHPWPPEPPPDPHEATHAEASQERDRWLRAAEQVLSRSQPAQVAVLVQVLVDGRAREDVAAAYGVSRNVVDQWVRRFRTRVHAALEKMP